MRPRLPRFLRWLIPLLLAAGVLWTHPIWLGLASRCLVHADQPFRADLAVVLAGGWQGNRILKAAELVRQGWAPRVLVSGTFLYDRAESDLAIDFAVKRGFPRHWFQGLPHRARSTQEEAAIVTAELKRLGARRVLVVTSDYHTRRALACFRQSAPDLEFRVVPAADEDFPAAWWTSRQGRKTVLLEWMKTIAWQLGM
ncbi:MAG: YdcF family protein [Bryobacteraceae bacterium]